LSFAGLGCPLPHLGFEAIALHFELEAVVAWHNFSELPLVIAPDGVLLASLEIGQKDAGIAQGSIAVLLFDEAIEGHIGLG
jgi:hypothetical protein